MIQKKIHIFAATAMFASALGGAQADEAHLSTVNIDAYKAAIESFGVDAVIAKQAAELAVEEVRKSQKNAPLIEENAFASLPADFLDSSPYAID